MSIKKFLRKNIKFIIIYIILFIILVMPLPYYITYPGGLINVADKIEIEGSNKNNINNLNLTYVSSLEATIPSLVVSFFNKSWDVSKEDNDVYENETAEEANFRNKLLLKEANDSAIIYSYNLSGKKVNIINNKMYVTYIDENSTTDLKIGDQILKVNGALVNSVDEIKNIVSLSKVGSFINISVKRNNTNVDKNVKVYEENGKKFIGILITEDKTYDCYPKIKISFDNNESGPSGGFMMSLSIYSLLNNIDLSHGKVIAGTGTIDINGNVGSIGGVKYKLEGAVKNKADIFIVPNGENYNEALKIKNEKNYKIEIIGIDNFNDALEYLK